MRRRLLFAVLFPLAAWVLARVVDRIEARDRQEQRHRGLAGSRSVAPSTPLNWEPSVPSFDRSKQRRPVRVRLEGQFWMR